ncbi:MAG: CHAT domain-containing protein [Armatimonadetes bacterium]|nr:CHAT domain-containing protein [Armatimonadota bacterium]
MMFLRRRFLLAFLLVWGMFLPCHDLVRARNSDSETLVQMNEEMLKQSQAGRYPQALLIAEKVKEICEKKFGPRHLCTAASYENLAGLCLSTGDTEKGSKYSYQALTIREAALGPEHPDTLHALRLGQAAAFLETQIRVIRSALEQYYLDNGTYPTTEQGLSALVEKPGIPPLPKMWSQSLTSLPKDPWKNFYVYTYPDTGGYALYSRGPTEAVRIWKEPCGEPSQPEQGPGLEEIPKLRQELVAHVEAARFEEAIPVAEKMLEIRKKNLGYTHPDTATSFLNLADCYKEAGDFAKADPLYRQSVLLHKRVYGSKHKRTATALAHQASFFLALGDHGEAQELYNQALQICEEESDREATYLKAAIVNNLSLIHLRAGSYDEAEPVLRRALDLLTRALGPENPETLSVMNNLGLLYSLKGDYEKGESYLRRVLELDEKRLGPQHRATCLALNNLSTLYLKTGRIERAESGFRKALEFQKESWGPDHMEIAMYTNNLAFSHMDLGRLESSLHLALSSYQIQEKMTGHVLSFAPEKQRLKFLSLMSPYNLLASLGAPRPLALAVLRLKGVVLDSLLEERLENETGRNPAYAALVKDVRARKRLLLHSLLETPKDKDPAASSELIEKRRALQEEIGYLENKLSKEVTGLGEARKALKVTVEQVQSALSSDAVLIEFILYQHYLGKGKLEPYYGAVVIRAEGEPRWVRLGRAEDVDNVVGRYRRSLRAPAEDAVFEKTLRSLSQLVWEPLEKELPQGARSIVLSPDGGLNFLSFGTLLDREGRFLSEKYLIRYVSSGRDLIKEVPPFPSDAMILFGDPDFTASVSPSADTGPRESGSRGHPEEYKDFRGFQFSRLPGTLQECTALQALAERHGLKPRVLTGKDADELGLRQVRSPRILHLATHGFFGSSARLGVQDQRFLSVQGTDPGIFRNPMYRSGLALAGAQSTLDAWKRAEPPPVDNDGIVTAEDVSSLSLHGTWLVVLSACDTGVGEAQTGEGVLGLRRGFVQAGARNLLFTLWPISDADTVRFMESLYEEAMKGVNPSLALARVQRTWLVKWRREKGLRTAVALAGPFVLTFHGRP